MIHSLRRRHLHGFATLAVLLPLGLGATLARRGSAPIPPPIPAVLRNEDASVRLAEEVLRAGVVLAGDVVVDVTLRRAPDDGRVIEIAPRGSLRHPDLLAYWARGTEVEAGLGDGDVLLGRAGGSSPRRYRLPAEAEDGPGRLVLYSLAHRQIVGQAALPDPTGDRPAAGDRP
jgi:hypothetical protein